MNAKIRLVLAVVLALCFLGLSIGALDVVPKHIEDRFYVVGVEGKWSNLVSLLFYVMAVMCGFYGWLVFRHIKYLLAELKNRLKISIFLWRKSCASR